MKWLLRFFRPAMQLTTAESGRAAQRFAEKVLKRAGYRILHRNLADSKGELDLVLSHSGYDGVIIAEVRSHSVTSSLRQEEVLPPSKQEQVVKTARRLLTRHGLAGRGVRFDAVLVALDDSGGPVGMEHFENAFTSDRRDWF